MVKFNIKPIHIFIVFLILVSLFTLYDPVVASENLQMEIQSIEKAPWGNRANDRISVKITSGRFEGYGITFIIYNFLQ